MSIGEWFYYSSETGAWVWTGIVSLLVILVGRAFASLISGTHGRFSVLLPILLRYILPIIVIVVALDQRGIEIKFLLGAAGVATIAVGFAAQTAVSNVISGIFLIGEKPFAIGDTIQVGEIEGEVLAINLLSVQIRRFNNTVVRIPSEALLKSNLENRTLLPIRRIDILLSLSNTVDLDTVRTVFIDVADSLPTCLRDPRPNVRVQSFGEYSVNLLVFAWTTQDEFFQTKNELYEAIRHAVHENEFSFPVQKRFIKQVD